jgi:uncharacterized protein (DUF4415 family)
MDSFQIDPLSHAPAEELAEPTIASEAAESGPGEILIDRSAFEVSPVDPFAFEMDVDRLEEHEAIRVGGRPLAELSDAELSDLATAEAEASGKAPAPPARRKPPAVLSLANLNVIWPEKHEPVHLRVDKVVMDWFRRDGEAPGPGMAAVLRAFVDAQLAVDGSS